MYHLYHVPSVPSKHDLASFWILVFYFAIFHIFTGFFNKMVFLQTLDSCTCGIDVGQREIFHHIFSRKLIGQTTETIYCVGRSLPLHAAYCRNRPRPVRQGTWVIGAVIPKYLSQRLLCPRDCLFPNLLGDNFRRWWYRWYMVQMVHKENRKRGRKREIYISI